MLDYRDRSVRLSIFGILTMLGGGGSLLLAVLYLLLPLAGSLMPEGSPITMGSILSGWEIFWTPPWSRRAGGLQEP
jgi:hypothetical protein